MAIKSTPFGPVVLSGEDASAFMRQCLHGRPKPEAIINVRKGQKLAAAFKRDGIVRLTLNDIKQHSLEVV